MNLKKGFFRLTLVLSISIGIISTFVMIEREPYTRFKVKRTGEGEKELTITLLWYGERDPDIFDFLEAFEEAETTDKRVIKAFIDPSEIELEKPGQGQKKPTTFEEVIRDPAFQTLRTEEQRKVLINVDPDFAGLPKGEQDKVLLAVGKIEVGKHRTGFTVLEKTAPSIKWLRFFLIMGIGFISVWLVYAFIRWVIVAFIAGGFRHKANS